MGLAVRDITTPTAPLVGEKDEATGPATHHGRGCGTPGSPMHVGLSIHPLLALVDSNDEMNTVDSSLT